METFYAKCLRLRSKLIGAAIRLYNLKQARGFAEPSHACVKIVMRMRGIGDRLIVLLNVDRLVTSEDIRPAVPTAGDIS